MPRSRRPAFSRGDSIFVPLPSAASIADVSPDWAWGDATGRGVTVAIVDSGVEAGHPQLEGCVDEEAGIAFDLEAGVVVERPGPHEDGFGHGTACAGIVHALAPEARIVSVRVIGEGVTGQSSVFLRGLSWAAEQGFDVINLSLGTIERDWALPFYEVCDRAYFGGSFVVTAASNVMQPSFPSLYASVTSVACSTADDPMQFHYNPDPPTEFLARGIDVEVAWKNGARRRVTGNSYAAPHVAGIAALIRSKHPELRPFQLKAVLHATAANVWGLQALPPPEPHAARRPQARIVSARTMSAVHSFPPVPEG